MEIRKMLENRQLTVMLKGELDTITAPELQEALRNDLERVDDLVIDMTDLTYISSAGLRVILSARKKLDKRGDVHILGAKKDIREIFSITGFDRFLRFSES